MAPKNGIFTNETHDLAQISSRPFEDVSALDLQTYTAPQLGDGVLGYGLGHTAKVWTGVIADINLNGNNQNRPEAYKILG